MQVWVNWSANLALPSTDSLVYVKKNQAKAFSWCDICIGDKIFVPLRAEIDYHNEASCFYHISHSLPHSCQPAGSADKDR